MPGLLPLPMPPLRGGSSARNVGLSDDVLALMPQISAACQANGIPKHAPLVAAVIMQESGGRVADVGGDVMQCADILATMALTSPLPTATVSRSMR